MANSTIPLAEVVQELRRQLQQATKAAEGEDLRFTVEDLELELQVVVTKDVSAKAGFSFSVLLGQGSAEASAGYEKSLVQTVKIKLRPNPSNGKALNLSGSGGPS